MITTNTLKITEELTQRACVYNHDGQFLHSFSTHKRKTVRILEKIKKSFLVCDFY